MDPIDIVKVPYDITHLVSYVTLTCIGVGIGCTYGTTLANIKAHFNDSMVLSMFFFVVFIVAGAPTSSKLIHTVFAALYTAVLCTSSFECDVSPRKRMIDDMFCTRSSSRSRIIALLFCFPNEQCRDLIARHVSYACLVVSLQMQIILLYDRGWQIQRWPAPVVIGSTLGWLFGHLTAAMMIP